jgi:hypothetical protein
LEVVVYMTIGDPGKVSRGNTSVNQGRQTDDNGLHLAQRGALNTVVAGVSSELDATSLKNGSPIVSLSKFSENPGGAGNASSNEAAPSSGRVRALAKMFSGNSANTGREEPANGTSKTSLMNRRSRLATNQPVAGDKVLAVKETDKSTVSKVKKNDAGLSPAALEILNDLTNIDSGTYSADLSQLSNVSGVLRGNAYVSIKNSPPSLADDGSLSPGGFNGRLRVEFIKGEDPVVTLEIDVIAALPNGSDGKGLRGGDMLQSVFPNAVKVLGKAMSSKGIFTQEAINKISGFAANGPKNVQYNHIQNAQANQDIIRYRGALKKLVATKQVFTLESFVDAYRSQQLPDLADNQTWEGLAHGDDFDALILDIDKNKKAYFGSFGEDFLNQLETGDIGNFNPDMLGAADGPTFDPDSVHGQVIGFMREQVSQTSGSLGKLGAGFMERQFKASVSDMYYNKTLDSWIFSFARPDKS